MHNFFRSSALAAITVTGLGAAAPGTIAAQDEPAHTPLEHQELDLDSELEWDELLEQTLRNYPRFVELAARDVEARALSQRGRSRLSGQPSVSVGWRSDQALDDFGLEEYESGLNLPLWRLGQRRAAETIGSRAADESAAAESALRLEVAGRLRQSLWDIVDALNAAELAAEALAVAVELERVVTRRYAVGDLPLEDSLLARSAVLDREWVLLDSEAQVVDAEHAYETLTGLYTRPTRFDEPLTARQELDETHPLLALAQAEMERAAAELQFAERSARGNPALLIGPRRQRDPLTSYFTDSFGVQVTIPFGGAAHGATATAAALRRAAEAEAERAALDRTLHTALHEAEHTLVVTDGALLLADQRADLAERHWQMGRTAFEEGEITLLDLLRREEARRAAARAAAGLRIQRGRTIAEINQAMGEIP